MYFNHNSALTFDFDRRVAKNNSNIFSKGKAVSIYITDCICCSYYPFLIKK